MFQNLRLHKRVTQKVAENFRLHKCVIQKVFVEFSPHLESQFNTGSLDFSFPKFRKVQWLNLNNLFISKENVILPYHRIIVLFFFAKLPKLLVAWCSHWLTSSLSPIPHPSHTGKVGTTHHYTLLDLLQCSAMPSFSHSSSHKGKGARHAISYWGLVNFTKLGFSTQFTSSSS